MDIVVDQQLAEVGKYFIKHWCDDRFGEIVFDGGDCQEVLSKIVVLTRYAKVTPCGEACVCAESVGDGEEVDCYVLDEAIRKAVFSDD